MALVGAELEIAGEMALENSTFTTSGRVRVPAGATLAFTNDAANTFRFLPNASLEIDGGTVDVGGEGSSLPFRLDAGSALHVTGTGALKLAGKKTALTARSETFSGQAQLTTYHVDVTAVGNNATNTLTLRDEALWTTVNDGAWTLGTSRHGNSCVVVNLESRQPVRIPYGVAVGAVQNAVLNLHKGQFLSGGGNVNGVGYACGDTTVTGIVNVVDGVFMQRSCAQYKKWLYGITVGDSMRTELTTHPNAYGRGTLNIHANGIVSNLTSYAGYGYGLYLRVGSGRGEGDINQMGGAFYHSGRYQAVLGLWGGTGRWTLTSNATARVCSDVYVGGSLTNLLCGFVEGKNVGASPEFMSTFDVDDHTAKGTLSVVSGTFLSPSNLFVSVDGTGTLVLGEDPAARLVARNVVLSNTVDAARGARYPSTLKFVFGAEGCGRLVCGRRPAHGAARRFPGVEAGDRPLGLEESERHVVSARRLRGAGRVVRAIRRDRDASRRWLPLRVAVRGDAQRREWPVVGDSARRDDHHQVGAPGPFVRPAPNLCRRVCSGSAARTKLAIDMGRRRW
mgnify:CR=1 FL=1